MLDRDLCSFWNGGLTLLAVLLGASVAQAELQFIRIAELPPGYNHSSAGQVSSDGSTVVGRFAVPGLPPLGYSWAFDEGLIPVGGVNSDSVFSVATGLTADGSKVVGLSHDGTRTRSFVWTAKTGIQVIPEPDDGWSVTAASKISAFGDVVIGVGTRHGVRQGYRWTEEAGMVALGELLDISEPPQGQGS